ncbi:MAG: beta-lactamase family protein, partial [Methanoregula sp.]|nr:beta-lactamase family protein [Methanoregula sp.]
MNNPSFRVAYLFTTACLLAGLIFCAGCTGTTGPTQPQTQNLEGLDDFISQKMAEYEVPGAVVGIVKNDTVVYLKGFGVREIEKQALVDPDTRFQIASVSKYVTAGAVGSLVDEGRLDWDTPVVRYLPGFALKDTYAGEHATLRDLLAHRTGFRHFDGDLLGRLGYSDSEMLER